MEYTSRQIREAVDRVFTDTGRNQRATKSYVIALAVKYLMMSPPTPLTEPEQIQLYHTLSDKVSKYLSRSNKRGGKIQMMSGKNGGTFLRHEVAGPTRLSQGEVIERIERAYDQLSSLTKDPLPNFKTPGAVSRVRALQISMHTLLKDLEKDAI